MKEGDEVLIETVSKGKVLESRTSRLEKTEKGLCYKWKGFYVSLDESTARITKL